MDIADTTYPATGGQADYYPRESARNAESTLGGEAACAAEAEGLMRTQMEDLARLRAIGLDIAERVGRKAAGLLLESEQDAFKGCDVVLAYTRVSRTVQQIVMQEQEIIGLREARVRRVRVAREESERAVRVERKDEERKVVRGVVREVVASRCRGLERVELTDLLDDLFRDYEDFDRGEPAEIVARICRELGVEFDAGVCGDVRGCTNGETPSPASLRSAPSPHQVGRGNSPSPGGFAATLSRAAEGGSLRHAESDLRSRGRVNNGHDPPP